MKAAIGKEFHFSAGHVLWVDDWSEQQNREVFGQCANVHGHNYKVMVSVYGDVDERTGMVLNYYDLNDIVKPIIDRFDHNEEGGLQNMEPFSQGLLTTAENIADVISDAVAVAMRRTKYATFIQYVVVRVSETDKTFAEVSRKL